MVERQQQKQSNCTPHRGLKNYCSYYYTGGLGILWFVVWLFCSYETPSDHPGITEGELKFIFKQQGDSALIYEVRVTNILTSVGFKLNVGHHTICSDFDKVKVCGLIFGSYSGYCHIAL